MLPRRRQREIPQIRPKKNDTRSGRSGANLDIDRYPVMQTHTRYRYRLRNRLFKIQDVKNLSASFIFDACVRFDTPSLCLKYLDTGFEQSGELVLVEVES